MIRTSFGFLPYREEFDASNIRVRLANHFEQAIRLVNEGQRVQDGWLYPPLVQNPPRVQPDYANEIQVTAPITKYATWFSPPSTHQIELKGTKSKGRAEFVIVGLGFCLGLRLLPSGYGHLFRTPTRKGTFGDFIASRSRVEEVILLFDRFYRDRNCDEKSALMGVIHALQWGASQEYDHIRFIHLYMALDGLGSLFDKLFGGSWRSSKVAHATLPRDLCLKAGFPIPPRARTFKVKKGGKKLSCKFAKLRNELFHEGLIKKKPVGMISGLDLHEASIDLECLIYRLLFFSIGMKRPSIITPVTSRQTHLL